MEDLLRRSPRSTQLRRRRLPRRQAQRLHAWTGARERDRKWAEIKAFEAAHLTVLTKADHRGLCRSVRPSTAPRPWCARGAGQRRHAAEKVKRAVVTVGANDAQLDDVLRELRRGERARVAFDDKPWTPRSAVRRVERAIAPRPSPWAPLIQGACRSKRVALGSSSRRPRWGDTVTVRIGDASLGRRSAWYWEAPMIWKRASRRLY